MAKKASARRKTAQVRHPALERAILERRELQRANRMQLEVRKHTRSLERAVSNATHALDYLTDWLVARGHGALNKPTERS